MKKIVKVPIVILSFVLFFVATQIPVTFAAVLNNSKIYSVNNIESQLLDVALLSKYYNSQTKVFNKNNALKNNFNTESINIADELYKANAEVIQKGISNFNKLDWSKYPKLKSFLNNADTLSKTRATTMLRSTSAASSDGSIWITLGKESLVRFVCGYFGNPQPNISQYAITWRNLSDSASTLRSWAYHPTNTLYGNGWTRAETWSAWACNTNSFRDYAWVVDSHTIKERNYDGWNPRGEPNPEINTYSWPYAEWPLYVAWWQSNHQG